MREGTVQPDADKMRGLRVGKGWTQEELAAKVGCSKKTVENIETGKPVLCRTLREIAQALGVPYAELLASPNGAAAPDEDPSSVPSGIAKNSGVIVSRATVTLELIIDRDFDSFGQEDLDRLLAAIKKLQQLCSLDGEVRVATKQPGSVRLRLESPPELAEALLCAVKAGELAEHGVVEAHQLPVSDTRISDPEKPGQSPIATDDPRASSLSAAKVLPIRAEDVFDQALEVEPARLQAFLDEACRGAPELRAEVEELLKYSTDEFFEKPPLGPIFALPNEEPSGEALPQTIGKYAVHSEIGRGAFGIIYLAGRGDKQYQDRVAIKVLKRGIDTEDILRRFRLERQTLVSLRKHPGIVTLFEAGSTDDGRPYFVMEYVEGRSLDQFCDEHKLPIDERLRVFRAMCDAVQYAHENLIVHRDLKPANILVTGKDQLGNYGVKLLDFGIAKLLNPELGGRTVLPTAPWQRFLTPDYASPEQVRGGPIDVTSDVYALGVICYELLTGHLPYHFNASLTDVERVICEQDPEKPSTKIAHTEQLTMRDGTTKTITPEYVSARRDDNPVRLRRRLSGDLDNIVLKALEKDPLRRYRSVQAFAQDIQRFLEGDPVEARGNPFGYRAGKFARKHKGKLSVAAAVFAALVALAGWAFSERSDALTQRDEAALQKKEADEARVLAEDRQRDALRARNRYRRISYLAHMHLVGEALDFPNVRRALDLLSRYKEREPDEEEVRGFEWYHYRYLCTRELATLRTHTKAIHTVASSKDGTLLATGGDDGKIKLWGRNGGGWREQTELSANPFAVLCLAFSPDGTRLAAGSNDGSLRIWDVSKEGKEPRVFLGHLVLKKRQRTLSVAFSPDGTLLAWGTYDGTIKLWKTNGPKEPVDFTKLDSEVHALAFAPDGRHLALAGGVKQALGDLRHVVQIWDVQNEQLLHTLEGHADAIKSLAFAPDSRTLASAGLDKSIRLWDVSTGRQQGPPLVGHRKGVNSVAFTDNGRFLASGGDDTSVILWRITPESVSQRFVYRGHTAPVTALAANPNGNWIASVSLDKSIKLWDLADGLERTALEGHTQPVRAVAVSPDGRFLATGGIDKTVRLWDLKTGKPLPIRMEHPGLIFSLAFSPDGRLLASGGSDQSIVLWEMPTGKVVGKLTGHRLVVTGLVFPSNRLLASASRDRTVRLWDVETRSELRALEGHTNEVWGLASSADGKTLVSAGLDKTVRIWDLPGGGGRGTLDGLATGALSVTVSTDGRTVAAGGKDGSIKIWDLKTTKVIHTIGGHTSEVSGLAFTKDGRTLVFSSTDSTIKLWDLSLGEEPELRATFEGHSGPVWSLALAPDEELLVSAGSDKIIRLWQAPRKGAVKRP